MAKKAMRFSALNDFPKDVRPAMHPDTQKIINQLRSSKRKVVVCALGTSREAKNRLDALRRAKKRGRVRYKEARRKADTLYIKLK